MSERIIKYKDLIRVEGSDVIITVNGEVIGVAKAFRIDYNREDLEKLLNQQRGGVSQSLPAQEN